MSTEKKKISAGEWNRLITAFLAAKHEVKASKARGHILFGTSPNKDLDDKKKALIVALASCSLGQNGAALVTCHNMAGIARQMEVYINSRLRVVYRYDDIEHGRVEAFSMEFSDIMYLQNKRVNI